MNKAIATRLARLEQAIAPAMQTFLVVDGTDQATWPKPEPGYDAIYVVLKTGVPRDE